MASVSRRLITLPLILSVAALGRVVTGYTGNCLTDAVALEDRVNLQDGQQIVDGQTTYAVTVPVGFWKLSWESAGISTYVAKILSEEVLGYNSTISGIGGSSASNVYATAGCSDAANFRTDPQCSENPSVVNHVAIEVWGTSKYSTFSTEYPDWPQILPEEGGSIGYSGTDGIYVYNDQLNAAYSATGLPLEYYKSYDVAWHTPSQYFDSYDQVDPSQLRFCNDTRGTHSSEMQKYIAVTGDSDGIDVSTDGDVTEYRAKCWYDSWWFSPACRNNPSTCVPSLTGSSGWGMYDTMQQAATYNMPIAIAVGIDNTAWRALGRQHRNIPYWWQPDASFIDLLPNLIRMPPYNAEERAQGIRTSAGTTTYLSKSLYNRLGVLAPRLHTFMRSLSISLSAIEEMIRTLKADSSLGEDDAACQWLQSHESTWRAWIPSQTTCLPGAGLSALSGTETIFVSSRSDATSCTWCTEGMYSVELVDDLGTTFKCETCPVGTYQSSPGQTSCSACEPGTFTNVNASRECQRCPVATYQNASGTSDCIACPSPSTTLFQAAQGLEQCVCPGGMYRFGTGEIQCASCPGGMTCDANSSEAAIPVSGQATEFPYPKALNGYMTRVENPLLAFKCIPADKCPGGAPGTCATGRDVEEVGCDQCIDDTWSADDGTCQPCSGGESFAIVIVGIIVFISVLCVLTFVVNKDVIRQSNVGLTCALIGGLLFMGLQAMGIFASMDVVWADPLKSMLTAMQLLTFDLQILKVDCMLGSGPVQKFLFRQLIAPVSICIIGCILAVKHRQELKLVTFENWRVEYVNTVGAIFMVLFISVAISAWSPFVCYKHFNAENSRSMVSEPSVLCFEDSRHGALVAIGLFAVFLVLVPFIGLAIYGTYKYKEMVMTGSIKGLRTFHFLFHRFTPSAYFYASILLARNLAMCLVPVITDRGELQILFMAIVLLTSGVTQLTLQPWRGKFTNLMDGILTASMVLLLLCISLDANFNNISELMGILGTIIVFAFLAFLLAVLSHMVYQYFQPYPWYDKFVCHHKAGAAAQARYVQLSLQARTSKKVFIDSDHLTNLDELFDTVRTRIGQLVVFATGATLRRPWCAGEITVSHKTHRRVVMVKMPSFSPPSEDELLDLKTYIDSGSTDLAAYRISTETICEAYRWLLGSDVMKVEPAAKLIGRTMLDSVTTALLNKTAPQPAEAAMQRQQLMIVSDPADDEATAAAGILSMKIQKQLMNFVPAGIFVLADTTDHSEETIVRAVMQSHAVVMILSQGSMQSQAQITAMVTMMKRLEMVDISVADRMSSDAQPTFEVVPVNIPSFKFPEESYWENTFKKIRPHQAPDDSEKVRGLFKRICVHFNIAGSEQVLDVQAHEILMRIPQKTIKMSGSMESDVEKMMTPTYQESPNMVMSEEYLRERDI